MGSDLEWKWPPSRAELQKAASDYGAMMIKLSIGYAALQTKVKLAIVHLKKRDMSNDEIADELEKALKGDGKR